MLVGVVRLERVYSRMVDNYLNVVKESINTVKLACTIIVVIGGYVSKIVIESAEGVLSGWKKVMYVLGGLSLLQSIERWSDEIIVESRYLCKYTKKVATELVIGGVLFILSEVFLFMSLLGTTVDRYTNQSEVGAVSTNEFLGQILPGIVTMSEVLVASMMLLLSSAYFNTVKGMYDSFDIGDYFSVLSIGTKVLGIWFILFQLAEYAHFESSIFSGVLLGCFFLVTGFHGLHVLIGWILLTGQLEYVMVTFRSTNSVGMSFSLIYWHFVDAVWFLVVT